MKAIVSLSLFLSLTVFCCDSRAEDISTPSQLRDALSSGKDVSLTTDISLTASDWLTPAQNYAQGVTINGNGYTVSGNKETGNEVDTILFDNRGSIDSIKNITFSGFVNVDKGESDPDDHMGAVIRNAGSIQKIDANFTNNQGFDGAAIFNGYDSYIGSINGNFIDNSTAPTSGSWEASGAAIFNQGYIGNITGYFSGNTGSLHGTIWGFGNVDNITATFEGNYRTAVGGNGGVWKITNSKFLNNTAMDSSNGQSGGAILMYGGANFTIEDTLFSENRVWWKGGAIASISGVTTTNIVNSQFIKNSSAEQGGAIYTSSSGSGNNVSTVNISNSLFKENHGGWSGGAIYNANGIYTITDTEFDGNYNGVVGVIYNGGKMTINGSEFHDNWTNTGGNINSAGVLEVNNTEIYKNKADYWGDDAHGAGAYISDGTATFNGVRIHDNTATQKGGAIYIKKGDVTLNNVEIRNNKSGTGGAVHSLVDLTVNGDGGNSIFLGNNNQTNSTGVFMETSGSTLYLNSLNSGQIVFDDIVDGNDYNIQIGGDLSDNSMIRFNNQVNNLHNLNMADGGSLYVDKDQELTMQAYQATNNGKVPQLLLDVEVDSSTNSLTNGVLHVSGDVLGTTNVVVNSLNYDTLNDINTVLSPFVIAENDNPNTSAVFNVSRVVGSPYLYETKYNAKGNEVGSVWYLGVKNKPNPGPKPSPMPVYAPEVVAYEGTTSAAVEQNRYVGNSIVRGLEIKSSCYSYPDVRQRLWVDTSYENAKIDSPSEMDANIYVFTAGLDVFRDYYNRAGVFGGYRNGNYDFSGAGKYYSDIGSELKTNSYLGGIYHQYSYDDWRILSVLFAGQQKIEMSTNDHKVSADTTALQYGADINIAKTFRYSNSIDLEPSLGMFYTHVNVDDMDDNAGKTAEFDSLDYGEVELALKAQYVFCRSCCSNYLYIKPSVIRTFSNGGSVKVSGLANSNSHEDATLGRLEIGGELALSRDWMSYILTGYTFGSDYKSYDVNLGLQYAW